MTRPPLSGRTKRAYLRARMFVLVIGIPQAATGVYLFAGGISNDHAAVTAAGALLVIVAACFVGVIWVAVAVAARRAISSPPRGKRSTELTLTLVNGAIALTGVGVGIVLARSNAALGSIMAGMCVLYLAYRAFVLWDVHRTK
ncbi:MAG TPA: hypothetical protein VF053_14590 [Streptosporangiales bacterium]